MNQRTRGLLALVGILLVGGLVWWAQHPTGGTAYSGSSSPVSAEPGQGATATGVGEDEVALADLPAEAAVVVRAIHAGGPFRYDRDGITFGNREGLLPARERGYYREYTVPTPGESDRGARRIVAAADGTLYWSDDHYASFRRILE